MGVGVVENPQGSELGAKMQSIFAVVLADQREEMPPWMAAAADGCALQAETRMFRLGVP
jgi:hypothetical protein